MALQLPPTQVCIMGCGRVGARLADTYHHAGYQVRVIDRNADSFERLATPLLRESAILGDGTDPKILERAEIRTADIFIAVTNGDNRNILAAQIARETYHVPHILCRIYDPRRHEIYKELGVNSFCPTLSGAAQMYDLVTQELAQVQVAGQAEVLNESIENGQRS